ncbi:MAG: Na/Pi cotransporter family protein [Pseudomonadota bacterium]
MENLQVLMAGVTAVILFVFGLEHFSREIEHISGERFRKFLGNATRRPVVGVAIGAGVTALIQSSSATSVIAISLVNAGVLSFKNSVGIIFGSNIGTTVTAQLVAFKLTAFAPLIIIVGFGLSLIRSRYSVFGKAIFYFGFVFFSLNLISSSLAPIQQIPALHDFLTQPQNPLLAILAGMLFTAAVQSSSVTTGLAIVFVQQGFLNLENAVPLIMGANIGTTATALIAVFNMDIAAKKAALSHFLFNFGGVLLFTPVLLLFGNRLNDLPYDPAIALAGIHVVFNLVTSMVFILMINPFVNLIDRLLGEGKMDFERIALPTLDQERPFEEIRESLLQNQRDLLKFLQENYSLVTLAIESNYQGIYEAAGKRIDYVNFLKRELISHFSRFVDSVRDEDESRMLLRTFNQFDYLFQIHDSINDIFESKKSLTENYIELGSDMLLLVREISSETLALFDDMSRPPADGEVVDIRPSARRLQSHLEKANRSLLRLLADPNRRDAGALTNFITYSQRLKDKLEHFFEMGGGDLSRVPANTADSTSGSQPT